MRKTALLFPAIGALALLPAIGAHAATSCSQELQQVAQTYHLSLSPPATAQAGSTANSPEQRGAASSPTGMASDLQKLQGMMSERQGTAGQGASAPDAGRTAAAPTTPSRTAEAPATTESRGLAGPDSLESSGGTLPPSTGSGARDQQSGGAAAADQLGPADRAKAEGMLSEAQAADAQGKGDQCLQFLRAAQGMLKGRQ